MEIKQLNVEKKLAAPEQNVLILISYIILIINK